MPALVLSITYDKDWTLQNKQAEIETLKKGCRLKSEKTHRLVKFNHEINTVNKR